MIDEAPKLIETAIDAIVAIDHEAGHGELVERAIVNIGHKAVWATAGTRM